MKLVLINSWYAPFGKGGSERSVQAVAEALVQRGHQVSVITSAVSSKPETEVLNGVDIYRLPNVNLYSIATQPDVNIVKRIAWRIVDDVNIVSARRVNALIERLDPDIVQTNCLYGFSPFVAAVRTNQRTKYIHTPRDYYLGCWRASMFRGNERCATPCRSCTILTASRRNGVAHSDAYLFISDFSRSVHDMIFEAGRDRPQQVVYNPIAPPAIPASPRAGYLGKQLTLGFIGRLSPHKGADLFVETITADTSLRGVVAGDGKGEFIAQLKAAADPDRIDFRGFVPPAELLARIDALVVPSRWDEPFGRVVIEAMGHGVPVIGAQIGGIPELIQPGVTGELFDPADAGSLDRAIASFRGRDIAVMSKNAIAFAENFRPAKIAESYERFFIAVLEGTA